MTTPKFSLFWPLAVPDEILFAASNGTSTPSATYAYDGEGRRVRKIGGDESIIFVYDAAGRLAAEYNAGEPVFTEEIPRLSYLKNDHLGSPRIVTDANGGVVSRKDFAAFGDETITSHRTPALGYPLTGPDIRQDYTGYQQDRESGLEYAQARYYNGQHGRFTSVDPLPASATIRNPQSFNRYSYVTNSPYKFVDPLGLALQDIGIYQTNSAFEAQRAEHQTLRDQQLTINEQYRKAQTPAKPLKKVASPNQQPKSPSTTETVPENPTVTSFSIEVGDVKEAKGKEILLPDGTVYSDKNGKAVKKHGYYAIVEYTFMDDDRNVVNSNNVEAREEVTVDSATPPEAASMSVNQRKTFEKLSPGGKQFDVIGVLGDKDDIKKSTRLGYTINSTQTITIRQGTSVYEIRNSISIQISDKKQSIDVKPK